jgi:GcrA cell cycle regulator
VKSAWTDEEKATAKKMWDAGDSASVIARTLGRGRSRNAVVGMLHRMGCASRKTPVRRINTRPVMAKPLNPRPKRVGKVAAAKAGSPRIEAAPIRDEPPPADVIRLEDLEHRHCRYPLGDPQAEGFGFCGADKVEGRPYCQPHCDVAYQPTGKMREPKGATW